jgi:hypothetical protein
MAACRSIPLSTAIFRDNKQRVAQEEAANPRNHREGCVSDQH